jgi:hypothetical protein
MKKIIRLTESDLARIVKRVIKEQDEDKSTKITDWPEVTVQPKDSFKYYLLNPKDGVDFVRYEKNTGNFFENGKKSDVWARIQPNLSKEQIMDWFKRNNIKVKPNV